jgi:hypothetical protein
MSAELPWIKYWTANEDFANLDRETGYIRDYIACFKDRKCYEPFVGWRMLPFSSTAINIAPGGIRRTWTPPIKDLSTPLRHIACFGSSNMFGSGVSDEESIPSFLARALLAKGQPVRVTNYGTTTYNANQCCIRFMQILKGAEIPDIAVFFDGVTDCLTGMVDPGRADAHHLHNIFARKIETWNDAWAQREIPQPGTYLRISPDSDSVEELAFDEASVALRAEQTMDNYLATVRIVRVLAQAHGVTPLFFWQPCLLHGRKPLASSERAILENPDVQVPSAARTHKLITCARTLWALAEQRCPDAGVYFLGDIFDDTEKPIYLDWNHVTGAGNACIANRIAETLVSEGLFLQSSYMTPARSRETVE